MTSREGFNAFLLRCGICKSPLGWIREWQEVAKDTRLMCFPCMAHAITDFPPEDAVHDGQSQTVEGGDSQSSPSAPLYRIPEGF